MNDASTPILVTGADGLLGRHARSLLAALNGAALFSGLKIPWDVREARRADFDDPDRLAVLAEGVSAVLHCAGVNRASDDEVEFGNGVIAEVLASALDRSAPRAQVVYLNSTHAKRDIPYGRGKAQAARILSERAARANALFTDIVLPHVFGEGGRPFYNSAAATLCRQVLDGQVPTIGEGAEVELVHAGEVVDVMLEHVATQQGGVHRVHGRRIAVRALYDQLLGFQELRAIDRFPDVFQRFDVALYNTLQAAGFPETSCTLLHQNRDARGTLFEAAKGGAGGQTFLSWTESGVERGNHFHRYKIERFVVLQGEATIRMRHVLDDTLHSFPVTGAEPIAIDMPTLYTHSILNTGNSPLLTMFWSHPIFDPKHPDTWAAPVLVDELR